MADLLRYDWSRGDQDPEFEFDNSGRGKLIVPGFGDCPVDFELHEQHRFSHGANDWTQSPRLMAREVSMLQVMDALTDKPNWNLKIFDDEIVKRWHAEALQKPMMSEKAWDWCVTELRDKAIHFAKCNFVRTYDSGSRIVKSDTLISEDIRQELLDAARPLLDQPEKDWHPKSNEQVLNLVHPSLFPLIYGKTRVLETGEVQLGHVFSACGKGEVCTVPTLRYMRHNPNGRRRTNPVGDNSNRCSTKFQWLPCEVEFKGEKGTEVEITSYINNLNPQQYKPLYGVIEKILSMAVKPWNAVLILHNQGRTPPRMITLGARFEPEKPDWFRSQGGTVRGGYNAEDEEKEKIAKTEEFLKLPDHPNFQAEDDDGKWNAPYQDGSWLERGRLWRAACEWKYKRIRRVLHPEPGAAFEFKNWKSGLLKYDVPGGGPTWGSSWLHEKEHNYYKVQLQKFARDEGLQVIVKLASIELTPAKPNYEGGNWHIEGMMNEHIVATAIYYYDIENTTESRIRFRTEADLDEMGFQYAQSDHGPLSELFGTNSLTYEPGIQELGSVATPQGRLLVFPNTLQHCVQPFQLADLSKPGHRRFLVLWLVDPHYRILSTRNVPPQRYDWVDPDGKFHDKIDGELPPELASMVHDNVAESFLSIDEAREFRLELMRERTRFNTAVDHSVDTYNFCEH